MRLIRQSFLYFKEGNSDKVYEIDLCDTGSNTYVVNFRYGRRGNVLKEATKTPVPVSLEEAEKIYEQVETEKLNKGYTASESGVSSIPAAPAFQIENTVSATAAWANMPAGKERAIVQRLHQAVSGNQSFKTQWKTSRVIWKAGEYKITEAAPYIISLFNNGHQLQQHSCVWALARCGGNTSVEALKQVHSRHSSASFKKLAAAGLLQLLPALEKEQLLQHHLHSLPHDVQEEVNSESAQTLLALLEERLQQTQTDYGWLEHLYLLATERKWIKPVLKKILASVPLRPNYFKHVRSIFKLAELMDDFDTCGMLSYRFERDGAMFVHHSYGAAKSYSGEIYSSDLGEYVNLHKELKKKNSRLSFSQRTKWYLHRRTFRRLKMMGNNNDSHYVKLAASLLLNYKHKKDFSEHFSTFQYQYINRNYQRIETRYPQNANAVYMHYILSGNNPELELASDGIHWKLSSGKKSTHSKTDGLQQAAGGFLKKLAGLFGKKKEEPAAVSSTVDPKPNNETGTPFLHLWNQLPQAFVQLLMDAQMEEIHQFADLSLKRHPDFNAIKNRLDKQAIIKLLLTGFPIPAAFGLQLAIEKYEQQTPDADLVLAMIGSVSEDARMKGKQWAETNAGTYCRDSNFVSGLLFIHHTATRAWAKNLLAARLPEITVKEAVCGKAISQLLCFSEKNAENEALIKDVTNNLSALFPQELKRIGLTVVADLLKHPHEDVLLFGLRLLTLQENEIDPNELQPEFIFALLQHTYTPVRQAGLRYLVRMSDDYLLKQQDAILSSSLSEHEDVRTGVAPVIGRIASADKNFGIRAAEMLMPVLLRKESSEGIHRTVSALLCNELSGYLQNANKEMALHLLYSNYSAAQNVGVMILEKYTDPSQLTINQVMALGAHENLNVRQWCWKFYETQTARVKYEKEDAVRLLESKWQDTRNFAMQYFRTNFAEADWNMDALLALADSVKPDVEAFGRELITKYFAEANGTEYLLKLSQHPSEKMQLFATNYLERFAADDPGKIESLEFYFRSVLTRVNKSRVAKNRIYRFLLQEGKKSEAAAKVVSAILSDVSATAAIGDKAACIDILMQLSALYQLAVPLKLKEIEVRS